MAALVATLPATAAADHPAHPSADRRIPGQPDFERVGDETRRYDPATKSYVVKRPGRPPFSYHGDNPASLAASGAHIALPASTNFPVCATSGHRIKVVYSPTPGAANPTAPATIRSLITRMNYKAMVESGRSSWQGAGHQMVVDCDASGQINVHQVAVAMGGSDDHNTIRTTVEGALGAPSGANAVKYLIFRDVSDDFAGVAGIGYMYGDSATKSAADSGSGTNNNRILTTSAMVWKEWWASHVTLHEIFHSMGSVLVPPGFNPDLPPFSNGLLHCNDGLDVMCYAEGGEPYAETRCPANGFYNTPDGVPLDCGYDTYFDALEETGEWLNTHWNVGGVENPYLTRRARAWHLRNSNSAGTADVALTFGGPVGVPIAGDWNGDGTDTPGMVGNGNVWLMRNSNTSGDPEVAFSYGNPTGMKPVVGDWNNDGTDTPGMFQAGNWYLRNSNTGGVSEISFAYGTGTSSPLPVTGDWNNDGTDTPGIRVGNTWYLRNSNTGGVSDVSFSYGNPSGHVPLTGDWDGNGTQTPGVYDTATRTFYLRNSNTSGSANVSFVFGNPGDVPVVGDWNGDGVDTVGVVQVD